MAKKSEVSSELTRVVPSWPSDENGDHSVTELTAPQQGALSPFGDDMKFPLPVEVLRYEHPTARPAH